MKFTRCLKKYFVAITVAFLALTLGFCYASLRFPGAYAADEDAFDDSRYLIWTAPLTIADGQFDSGSGVLGTPSSWTGERVSGAEPVTGILDLSAYSANVDSYKLKDRYDEFKNDAPDSPFGKANDSSKGFEGSNRKVLLINSDGNTTTYGYRSQAFTLEPASYYGISVWLRTGAFHGKSGASVVIDGFDGKDNKNIGIYNIDTTKIADPAEDDYRVGWREHTIYIATPAYTATEATLTLSLGAADRVGSGEAQGYVMFDNITAKQYSPKTFADAFHFESVSEDGTGRYFDLYDGVPVENGDFSSLPDFWSGVKGSDANALVRDVEGGAYAYDHFGMERYAYAPGFTDVGTNRIQLITSYDETKDAFKEGYNGIISEEIEVKRYALYRVAFWAKTESLSGGGATAAVHYKAVGAPEETESKETRMTGVTGDESNYARFGWKQHAFYIRGSAYFDFKIQIELALGSKDSKGKGLVLYDDVTMETLTPARFAAFAEGDGTKVELDSVTDESGLTNGNLDKAGEYEELVYPLYDNPLPPEGWTLTKPSANDAAGYDKTDRGADDIVSGLVPVEDIISLNLDKAYGGALRLSSPTLTAFAYKSSGITVAASTAEAPVYKEIAVTLAVSDISGYGASLVLKNGASTVANIEGIRDTLAKTQTYKFYVKGGNAEAAMTLEVWLGMANRLNAAPKLSAGDVFVTGVRVTDSTAEAYDAAAASYKVDRRHAVEDGLDYAVVPLTDNQFYLFDNFDTDNNAGLPNQVKHPYNWSMSTIGDQRLVRYGIFAADPISGSQIPAAFKNPLGAPYILLLENLADTASTLTLDTPYALSASGYYKLSVAVKVDLNDAARDSGKMLGASIKLSSGDFVFKDIKDTSKKPVGDTNLDPDKEVFRTYTFYIKAGDAESTLGLTFGLGGSENPGQRIAGRLYIGDITLETIDNVAYDDAADRYAALKKNNDRDVNEAEEYATTMIVDQSSAAQPEEGGDTPDADAGCGDIQWWLIPSILLAVLLIVVVVGSFIRRKIDNRPKKVTVKKAASYDRRLVSLDEEEVTVDAAGKTVSVKTPDSFESFDDDAEPAAEKSVKKPKPVKEVRGDEFDETDDLDDADETDDAANAAKTDEMNDADNADAVDETNDAAKDETPEPTEAAAPADMAEPAPAEPTTEPASEPAADKTTAPDEKAEPDEKAAPKKAFGGFEDDFED